MGSTSNQTATFNTNASLISKDTSFLKQKMMFNQQSQQGTDLPLINSNTISSFMNRPFSEDTPNQMNKIEGKKTLFNRKTTIQQKQNLLQQQQVQQQATQNSNQGASLSVLQQGQVLPKLKIQNDSAAIAVNQNFGEPSTAEKAVEEQERKKPQGFVEKIRQLKNVNAKQAENEQQNTNVNIIKVNKLQSPAITMAFRSLKHNEDIQLYLNNYEDHEEEDEEEIEYKINREDTQFSDESANSPNKSNKFQLSSSDASNGLQSTNGKSINLLQQKKEKQANTQQDEQISANINNAKTIDFNVNKDESKNNQEEKKSSKNDQDQIIQTKSIRERFSLPEKAKDSQIPPIKEISKANSQKDQSQIPHSTSQPASLLAQSELENSKAEASLQKIVKWKSGDFIGAGSFGQVFTAMNCNTGEIFVVKKIMVHGQSKLDKEFLDEQEKELRIMQTLSHKHIIQYKGHERQQDCLCIFLEYMSEGNIDQMLKKFGPLEEQTIKVYARQILSGIQYLHSQKVIHKDIKGANILVGSDGIVKLSDFGCAKQLELTLNSNKEMNKTLKGSVPWMSPEIVTQTKYDTKADIWSFGCTILEMAQAEAPWSNYQFDNPIAAIMKIGVSNEIPKIPETISPELNQFIRKCLQRDPSERPTATELLNDSFLAEN
ncbi:hypothetical protein ABPG72_017752 [Tetrahymena utriculariae]